MNYLRDEWVSFIRSSAQAGRFLYTGSKVDYTVSKSIEENSLKHFLIQLSEKPFDYIFFCRIYYLIQPRVQVFFQNHLRSLIRSISHVINGKLEVSHRGVRGKILWTQTLCMQKSGRANAGTYTVKQSEKSSDIPENRLLKFFLLQICDTIRLLKESIGSSAIPKEILEMELSAQLALKEPHIKEVPQEYKATGLMYQRAKRHRDWRYRELADLQIQMDAVITQSKWESILQILQQGWLAPINDDDLFELYVLIVLLDVLAIDLAFGKPVEFGLIRRNRKQVARFLRPKDGLRADVYFDQSLMQAFSFKSEYKKVINQYTGISGSEHRPDIILSFYLADGSECPLLIEIKNTQDIVYKRDSVYKALAYLYDFRNLWNKRSTQSPKIILVFPEGVVPKVGVTEEQQDLSLLSANDRARFANLLLQVIQ
ncbi:DUF2357 domain-containing protein [Nostoc sp. CMAA1605]|uniref:DUF2357 domain-containing protein n=1 Tax=Nostoc sp. CMAA1605 TaxID=2055159 RepID=UPI001F211F8C|nr:DUF2357 domain-containing protein [Nostoc sp. CMAA1605]MCF4967376.1 hypothetical protein [Nostoc sp. CMAA1605]